MATTTETQQARTRIAAIDLTLSTGARSITLDGVTVTIDTAALAAERRRLELLLPERRRRRPRAFNVRLNG